jgi:hypothetical protein
MYDIPGLEDPRSTATFSILWQLSLKSSRIRLVRAAESGSRLSLQRFSLRVYFESYGMKVFWESRYKSPWRYPNLEGAVEFEMLSPPQVVSTRPFKHDNNALSYWIENCSR